ARRRLPGGAHAGRRAAPGRGPAPGPRHDPGRPHPRPARGDRRADGSRHPLFAWWEAAPRGATPGKRLLGFRVSRLDGGGLSGSGSTLRSAVKIAVPWEVAHTAVWNSLVWPGPDAPVNALLFTVANGLLLLY